MPPLVGTCLCHVHRQQPCRNSVPCADVNGEGKERRIHRCEQRQQIDGVACVVVQRGLLVEPRQPEGSICTQRCHPIEVEVPQVRQAEGTGG